VGQLKQAAIAKCARRIPLWAGAVLVGVETGRITRWHYLRETTERYVIVSGSGLVNAVQLPDGAAVEHGLPALQRARSGEKPNRRYAQQTMAFDNTDRRIGEIWRLGVGL